VKSVLTENINNQSGSVLVIVMLVLLAVTALGVMAINTGTTELDVASSDKFHTIVFFAADGANEMASELLEQDIEEGGGSDIAVNGVNIATDRFYGNSEDTDIPSNNFPSSTNHDIEVPDMGASTVYIKVYGGTGKVAGSALQMAAGYEGIGKSLAGGGAARDYNILSQANGPGNSTASIWLCWRHLI
jgi:hypothetical protein